MTTLIQLHHLPGHDLRPYSQIEKLSADQRGDGSNLFKSFTQVLPSAMYIPLTYLL